MDREILFRGKRLDKFRPGEWIYGYYVPCCFGSFPCRPAIVPEADGQWEPFEVDPSTVGQYTGLNDKNGVKIFEGDIVKTHSGLIGRVAFGSFDDDETETDTYGWYWRGRDKEGNSYFLGLDPEWGGHQVIGNIHDQNPELIGGEDDG